jgi:hypothetical protein
MKPNAMDAESVYQSVAGMPFPLKTDMYAEVHHWRHVLKENRIFQ